MTLIKAIETLAVALKDTELGGDVVVVLDPPDFYAVCKDHGVPLDANSFFFHIAGDRAVIVRRRGRL